MPNFTPTEKKIMLILSDQQSHTKKELFDCLPDELGDIDNVQVHLTNIRKKIRPLGQDIACELVRDRFNSRYRLIRLLASPYV